MAEFKFKTTPYPHQEKEWKDHGWKFFRALFWDQGTGKTKEIIDQAGKLFSRDNIEALIIIAPSGVHYMWETDELPNHCAVQYIAHSWNSSKASTKRHERAANEILYPTKKELPVLLMSYDGYMTKKGKAFTLKFAKKFNCMCVLDESQRIKNSGKRSQSIVTFGKRFKYKRILSGTPVTKNPLDIYRQLKFLNPQIWIDAGFADWTCFKTYFGIWETRFKYKMDQGGQYVFDADGDRIPVGRFPHLVAYRNIEELKGIVLKHSSRLLKTEVLDLPKKIYSKRYFDLEGKQATLYKALEEEYMTFLDTGELITAEMAIVRMLKLQQISCGYIPSEETESLHMIGPNPRLALLKDVLLDLEGKALIFSRFTQDIDFICQLLGNDCVRYDGQVGQDQRLINRQAFQNPDGPRYFVGNPAACATGLTLTQARAVIYYSNSFDLEHRLQSEDRAHRIGQENDVYYIDLCGRDTVDARIADSLRSKFDLACQVTGDYLKEWI